MFLDGSVGVSQHIEREAGCALGGGAIWPGLLEPSYLRGPSDSTLQVSALWPPHSSSGVDAGMGRVGGEWKGAHEARPEAVRL